MHDKILLDTCVSKTLQGPLQEEGHDVLWTGDWASDPGDAEILAFAYREGCILVTLDKDFGTLAVLHGKPHAGIIRLVNLSIRAQRAVCLHILTSHQDNLAQGAIITAEQNRLRIRMPD